MIPEFKIYRPNSYSKHKETYIELGNAKNLINFVKCDHKIIKDDMIKSYGVVDKIQPIYFKIRVLKYRHTKVIIDIIGEGITLRELNLELLLQ